MCDHPFLTAGERASTGCLADGGVGGGAGGGSADPIGAAIELDVAFNNATLRYENATMFIPSSYTLSPTPFFSHPHLHALLFHAHPAARARRCLRQRHAEMRHLRFTPSMHTLLPTPSCAHPHIHILHPLPRTVLLLKPSTLLPKRTYSSCPAGTTRSGPSSHSPCTPSSPRPR